MSTVLRHAFKLRGWVMVPVVVFLVFFTRGETEDAWVVFPAGLGVFAAGVLMRIWAQVHLHYRLKIHKILTTTGPYAYMRNPIYAGNAAMFVGLCVMSELVWLAPVVLVWCAVVYSFVVRYEESRLILRYGEPYLDYAREVPRWIPKLHGPRERLSGAGRFLWPSVAAELHCLLLPIPFALKELLS